MEIIKVGLYKSEVAIVEDLAKEIWHEHYESIIGREQTDYMLTRFQSNSAINMQIESGYEYYLIKVADKYVGYFAYKMETPKPTMFLSKLYILKSQRGNGYSKHAIKFIEQMGRQHGMTKIYLNVNKQNQLAIEAYLHLGFKQNGSTFKDIGKGYHMDDYFFEKEI